MSWGSGWYSYVMGYVMVRICHEVCHGDMSWWICHEGMSWRPTLLNLMSIRSLRYVMSICHEQVSLWYVIMLPYMSWRYVMVNMSWGYVMEINLGRFDVTKVIEVCHDICTWHITMTYHDDIHDDICAWHITMTYVMTYAHDISLYVIVICHGDMSLWYIILICHSRM